MIVGRKRELEGLEKAYSSKRAQFITIYGRRRVGKTFLIEEFFGGKECTYMYVAGIDGDDYQRQLYQFSKALSKTFFKGGSTKVASNWIEAFEELTNQIEQLNSKEKIVIFLDELPWLNTSRSNLLREIAGFWNAYWSKDPRIVFVVCGSSASWILQKVIFDKGGLHNRTTLELNLKPFNLAETKEFLENKGAELSNKQVLTLYMAIGGIPYYLEQVRVGLSAQQNIQYLFFSANAPLRAEFHKLFDSLFSDADAYKEIIALLCQHRGGLSRSKLAKTALLSSSGGTLTERLNDLCMTDFVEDAVPWGQQTGEFYRVIDEFCLFYIKWVAPMKKRFPRNYWIRKSKSPSYYAWSGYAFEAVCMKHYDEIVDALGIESAIDYSWWRYVTCDEAECGAQIDFIIDRDDDAITICEIKYTDKPFAIQKSYAAKLEYAIELFKKKNEITKQVFFSMVSANGLQPTKHSERLVTGVVTLDDLFIPISHL